MKQIDLYLVEKLKINKDINNSPEMYDGEWVKVNIPVVDYDVIHSNQTWKTLELPISTYVIFKDMYRAGLPHLADTGDFINSMCYAQDDYEDFNPKKDILYASNDLKDILEWYFNYLGIDELPKDEDDLDEWEDKYYDNPTKHRIIDDLRVLGEFYLGIDNFYDDYKEFTFDKKELLDYLGSSFVIE